jgi:hypothetical protein
MHATHPCTSERLDVSLAEYRKRFRTAPARLLDAENDASADYHSGLTVAKTFTLGIDKAGLDLIQVPASTHSHRPSKKSMRSKKSLRPI